MLGYSSNFAIYIQAEERELIVAAESATPRNRSGADHVNLDP